MTGLGRSSRSSRSGALPRHTGGVAARPRGGTAVRLCVGLLARRSSARRPCSSPRSFLRSGRRINCGWSRWSRGRHATAVPLPCRGRVPYATCATAGTALVPASSSAPSSVYPLQQCPCRGGRGRCPWPRRALWSPWRAPGGPGGGQGGQGLDGVAGASRPELSGSSSRHIDRPAAGARVRCATLCAWKLCGRLRGSTVWPCPALPPACLGLVRSRFLEMPRMSPAQRPTGSSTFRPQGPCRAPACLAAGRCRQLPGRVRPGTAASRLGQEEEGVWVAQAVLSLKRYRICTCTVLCFCFPRRRRSLAPRSSRPPRAG